MRVYRFFWSLLLLICLLALPNAPRLTMAQTEASGVLVLLQPATDAAPALMRFYDADAQLAHEMSLPDEVSISADALAPDARHLVYLSGAVSGPEAAEEGETLQSDLILHVLRTTDGEEVAAVGLLPSNFPENVAVNTELLLARDPTLDEFGDLEEAVWQAFRFSLGIFAWSPDGTRLAFSAATDGPSSDLYLFDTETSSVTRLTDGIEQIDGIRWSPDGRWIWHSTISFGYCQVCDGHHYAAAADGSEVITLPGSDIYRFLAWVDGDSYLVTDQANGPGDFALQLVDVPTGQSQMLWPGTHQGFIYDGMMNRLAILGTRGRTYDPNEQVFILDLTTGDEVEYDDLENALEDEAWLAPLNERPITYPCHRTDPIVYPCLDTPYDQLSPDGQYRVTDRYAVIEVSSGEQLLPLETELPSGRRVLWRSDSAGFFMTFTPEPNSVVYRELATGKYTVTEDGVFLTWLPDAMPGVFVAAPQSTPPAPAPDATQRATPTAASTPVATAVVDIPYRPNTLDGPFLETASILRRKQSEDLATIAQAISTSSDYADQVRREIGLHLLLAHEAAATYLYPPSPHPADISAPDPLLEARLVNTLDAALATAPTAAITYPSGGNLANSYTLALSPDGSIVASGNQDGNILLWDYASGKLLRVLPSSIRSIRKIQFSSDGTMLAATGDENQTQMWHVESGLKSTTHFGQDYYTYAIAWRPNSHDLAVANGRDTVMIHPRSQSAYALFDPSLKVGAEALAYSPDGSKLAVALQVRTPTAAERAAQPSLGTTERPIWIVNADTGELLHEFVDDLYTYFLTYSLDGRTLLAATSYDLRAWDVDSGTLLYETSIPDTPDSFALTPDGTEIAILSRRGGVTFFDVNSGVKLRNIAVDADVLASLAIHPTDGTLISSDINGRPILIRPEDGSTEFRFGPPRARVAAVSPVSPLLATADVRVITLYDLNSGRVLRELQDAAYLITDMAFSMDGKWLAAREETGYLSLWEADRGILQWRVAISSEWNGKVAFTPGGYILTGGSDGVLRMIDPLDGSILGERDFNATIMSVAVSPRNEAALGIGHPDGIAVRVTLDGLAEGNVTVRTVAEAATIRAPATYSPDGSLLAVVRATGSGNNATLDFYATETNELVQSIEVGSVFRIDAVAFSPDGKSFATGAHTTGYDRYPIILWEIESGRQIQSFGVGSATATSTRLAFTPDGTQLLASNFDGVTSQYSVAPSPALRTIPAHGGSVWDVAVSPEGRWAATAGDDWRVRVWDWTTGTQRTHVIKENERVYSVDFSPNGDALLTGGYEGEVRLYDAGGTLQQTFTGHTSWIREAIFRPDGNAFATASQDGSVRTWSRTRGTQIWSVEGLPLGVGAITYSPDSNFLAGAAGGGSGTTIYIWDAYSGEETMQLKGHATYVADLAYSPDGTLLASGSWDHTVKLWDAATGAEIATLEGHSEILTGLAFSPDGSLLASVAEDYTLRLWDVASHTEQIRIDMPRALPWAVAFTPDGTALLTAHADGNLRTWLVDPADNSLTAKMIVAAARVPRATAEFTAQERGKFAIDSFVGSYPLSASANVNLRPEPYVKSLIVQPSATGSAETLFALTNEKFLLSSTDQGESWRIVARLPLTYTYHSLGVPARPTDPLLITSEEGLYRVGDNGALTLVHSQTFYGVSYSHTSPNELWAVYDEVYKSEDGGTTWGLASNDLDGDLMFGPLLLAPPNNNPQFVASYSYYLGTLSVWRGANNGFWTRLETLPELPRWTNREQGIAWDAANRTLYFSSALGELYASDNADTPNIAAVSTAVVEQFGDGTRPLPLAVGQGGTIYLNLITSYGLRFVRGTWEGDAWQWAEIRLPLVAAG